MGKGWKRYVALSLTVCCAALVGCGTQAGPSTPPKPAAINGGEAPAVALPSTGVPGSPALASAASRLPASIAPAGPPADPLHPKVKIETSLGDMIVELDGAKAELTVNHFLTNYVDGGDYTHTIFHQVFKGYVIVGGSFTPDGKEKPAKFSVRNEAHNGLKNVRGTIALARQPDALDMPGRSSSSTWPTIRRWTTKTTTAPPPTADCVFGHVVQGLDVVDRIANSPVKDASNFESTPIEPVLIKSIHRVP